MDRVHFLSFKYISLRGVMKNLICLLISILLLVILGCSSDKGTKPVLDEDILGEWVGYAELISPGAADEPVYDSAFIYKMTLNIDGSYSILGSEIPPYPPMPIPMVELSGKYNIGGDSIQFIPDITDRPPREPYSIEGRYGFALDGAELTLTQVLHPDSWPEIHTVDLMDSDSCVFICGQ